MVAAIDIGNTFTHFGFYRGSRLVSVTKTPTALCLDKKRLKRIFTGKAIAGAAIASVVPVLNRQYTGYFKKSFRLAPLFISSALKLPLRINYNKPENLGADRLASSAGGFARYHTDLLVLNFGTATTIDVILKKGAYAGGIIAPGIETSFWALAQRTALLRHEQQHGRPAIIGTSTRSCIRSGVLNGTAYMVQGFIKNIKKKFSRKFLCVATGGWGKVMKASIPEIDRYDPDLCLFGILTLYHANT